MNEKGKFFALFIKFCETFPSSKFVIIVEICITVHNVFS